MKKLFYAIIGAALLLVSCNKESEVKVSSVKVSPATLAIYVGDSSPLSAVVTPDNAADKNVKWSSSMTSVATVSSSGVVTGVAEGTAVISALADGITGTCTVTVSTKFIPVTSVTLDKESPFQIVKGETEKITATVGPDDASDKTVTWTSSDNAVATVDNSGNVSALAAGTAVISAKAGDVSASCEVIVVIPAQSISLNKTALVIVEEQSFELTATVYPEDSTDKTLTWESSAPDVVKVEDGLLTALKPGQADITVSAGEVSAVCKVTVEKKFVQVSSVTLDKTSLDLVKGENATLVATVLPSDASEPSVTWTCSDEAVASVDASGKVTATGGGSAVISAKAGDITATCDVTVTVPVEGVEIDPSSITLEVEENAVLVAKVLPEDATDKSVSWSSSSSSVVKVDKDGNLSALKIGTATITVKASGHTATCAVTVKEKSIHVTSVTLNKSTASLNKGASFVLVATVMPYNATDKTVTWTSSDPSVASVNESGKVSALKGGKAVISAKADKITATCEVTVIAPVETITLSPETCEIARGEEITLTATVGPEDATDKSVSWSTSNKNVATVDSNGTVRGVGKGQARITVRSGNVSAQCTVTVTMPVEGISLDKTSLVIGRGNTATLKATVTPADASDKSIVWSSSDASVASVSDKGVVTAIKKGKAVITANASGHTASCNVEVNAPVTEITLSESSLKLKRGETYTLVATVNPADADDPTVVWSTSNSSVAKVDANGKITAVSSGNAVIKASSGSITAQCKVEVYVPVESLTLDQHSATIEEGKSVTLHATIGPEDATTKSAKWTVSDSSVISVSYSGEVTGLKPGTAVVTAEADGITDTCTITVTEKQSNTEGFGDKEGEW